MASLERLLTRLERRYGRYVIDNATWYLVGIQAFVFAVVTVKPEALGMLTLDAHLVMQGQVHRLLTWLFIPVSMSPIWVLFALYWLYTMGTSLESEWGSFRFQLYWGLGALLTLVTGFATETSVDNAYLLMSLFLAFATLWPDYEIRVFFILPVKVKWLALIDVAFIGAQIARLPGWQKLIPVIAIANYLLFFTRPLLDTISRKSYEAGRAKEWNRFKVKAAEGQRTRVCKVCGKTDADPKLEFRVCDCQEKCGGKATDFCLEHALLH